MLSTAGDTHLGGDDVDQMLVEVFLREIWAELGRSAAPIVEEPRSVALSAGARQALRMAAERAKCELSEAESASESSTLCRGSPGNGAPLRS